MNNPTLKNVVFSRPSDLLKKAERDRESLVRAIDVQDEAFAREALFNFAVAVYHIKDWIKADHGKEFFNGKQLAESVTAFRDLANASKHAELDLNGWQYTKHPPVVTDCCVSVPGRESSGATNVVEPYRWRLKVQLPDRRVAVEDLAMEALTYWRDFFQKHSIS